MLLVLEGHAIQRHQTAYLWPLNVGNDVKDWFLSRVIDACRTRLQSRAPDRHKNEGFTNDCEVEDVLDEEWFGGRSGVLAMMIRKVLDVDETKCGERILVRLMRHGVDRCWSRGTGRVMEYSSNVPNTDSSISLELHRRTDPSHDIRLTPNNAAPIVTHYTYLATA